MMTISELEGATSTKIDRKTGSTVDFNIVSSGQYTAELTASATDEPSICNTEPKDVVFRDTV